MAVAINARVRVALRADLNGVTPQPALNLGVVVRNPGGGTNDVLFDNGTLAAAVPDAQLDLVTDPPVATAQAFIGRVVRPIPSASLVVSQEYTGKVVSILRVAFGGGGGTDDRIVMQLLNDEQAFIEVPVTLVEVISDR